MFQQPAIKRSLPPKEAPDFFLRKPTNCNCSIKSAQPKWPSILPGKPLRIVTRASPVEASAHYHGSVRAGNVNLLVLQQHLRLSVLKDNLWDLEHFGWQTLTCKIFPDKESVNLFYFALLKTKMGQKVRKYFFCNINFFLEIYLTFQNSPNHLESLWPSRKFSDNPESFQIIQNVFRPS